MFSNIIFRGMLAMKTIITLVLAGTALAGGVANAATQTCTSSPCITTEPTVTPGGSDLILFVTNTANGNSFVQDLGVNVDSLGVTTASVESDYTAGNNYSPSGNISTTGPLGSGGPITVGAGIISGGVDSALAAWETANSGGTFYYGILGAAAGDGSTNPGQGRYVATFTTTNGFSGSGSVWNADPQSSDAASAASFQTGFFLAVNGNTATYDYTAGTGVQAASAFGSPNGAALGTTTYFYEVATWGPGNDANIYASTDAITVGTGGEISGLVSASAVPLPAAFWLLGSGVLGLFGIGRRRRRAIA
jgi:hypothetical protein